MIRFAPLLLAAVAVQPRGGCGTPRARLVATRLEGTRPEYVQARCLTTGLAGPLKVAWTVGAGLKSVGWNIPEDEPARLLQLVDGAQAATLGIACTAIDPTGRSATAATSLAPVVPTAFALPVAPKTQFTIDGSGFGGTRGEDDAVYFVPARGRTVRADHGCAGASWADGKILACLPADAARGSYQVRVQHGGRLGLLPGAPVAIGAVAK